MDESRQMIYCSETLLESLNELAAMNLVKDYLMQNYSEIKENIAIMAKNIRNEFIVTIENSNKIKEITKINLINKVKDY